MSVRLPDPRGSRAVLIGTSSYDSVDLKPLLAVRNNLEVLQELLTSDSGGGFLPGRCTVVQDSSAPQEVCRKVREAAQDAPDTLLVYFSGHGILNYDYSELYLALTGADQNDLRWTAVPFQALREIFETSSCRNKILILDCCRSGWILDAMMGDSTEASEQSAIRGTYLLTSSSADLLSYAPPGDRYTAFSGELIQLMRDGVPGGPELLSLSALYGPLCEALKRRSMPLPQQQGSDGHAELAIVSNRAVTLAEDVSGVSSRPAERERAARGTETRFGASVRHSRVMQWGIAVPAVLGLGWLISAFGIRDDQQLDLKTPEGIVTSACLTALVLILAVLWRRYPSDYYLIIRPDGIEVRYGKNDSFSYPWHRVSRVWVRTRPGGRIRGPRYELLLRPKPGAYISTSRRGSPGPRRDATTGALHFAALRHLDGPPAAVEAALAEMAGSAWTPSAGPLGSVRNTEPIVELTADRKVMTACAVLFGLLAYAFFPERVLTEPETLWLKVMPLLFCALSCGVCWFSVSRLVSPVRLVVSAAGLRLTRAALEISYAWSEIEEIALVGWPRGMTSMGLLAVRPSAGTHTPVDRTGRLLPRLTAGRVTLCVLPEIADNHREVKEALERFAGDTPVVSDAGDWLYSSPAKAARSARRGAIPHEGSSFAGYRSVGVAVLLTVLLMAPGFSASQFMTNGSAPPWLDALYAMVLGPLPLIGLPAYFLLGRHRVTFHVGVPGLTLVFRTPVGTRSLRVPWGDIESIGIVCSPKPVRHSLVVWFRPGAVRPRSLWWPCQTDQGGLRILSLEGSRLDVSPDQLDLAVARYAGQRHSPMMHLARQDWGSQAWRR
ncbi:caspase family protein [Streptomyces sp. NBC_01257]|uniref:caspase family protein n=1 Tax=Streptomyces sp. NBC_01257 TaxID=2903799 RepID=UPI002DDA72C0|nr:caspase family protein [Streptomyces sp. NBC_01257]WRZ62634.1 caspase family protein [Streptomyces sp. NBC_01257]